MRDTCKNCGGPRGLHQYETGQCPLGGTEHIPNVWTWTTYEEEDDTASRIAELEAALKEAHDKQQRRIRELEKALKPLADIAPYVLQLAKPHEYDRVSIWSNSDGQKVTLRDVHNAVAILKEK